MKTGLWSCAAELRKTTAHSRRDDFQESIRESSYLRRFPKTCYLQQAVKPGSEITLRKTHCMRRMSLIGRCADSNSGTAHGVMMLLYGLSACLLPPAPLTSNCFERQARSSGCREHLLHHNHRRGEGVVESEPVTVSTSSSPCMRHPYPLGYAWALVHATRPAGDCGWGASYALAVGDWAGYPTVEASSRSSVLFGTSFLGTPDISQHELYA